MDESESNLTPTSIITTTPTATSTSNPAQAPTITPTSTSSSAPAPTITPTSTLNLTDLDALINALPANRLYPDAKPKPILAAAIKAIKHAYTVADHSTPVDKTALDTAKNYTSAARATYDAAKHTVCATQTALDAADANCAAAHDATIAALEPAEASKRANEIRARDRAELLGHNSYSWSADENLRHDTKKAFDAYTAAYKAARAAIDAREAAIINFTAAAIALAAAESAERIVAKVVGITPNDRYLDPGVVTDARAAAVRAADDARATADALHSAARARGVTLSAFIGGITAALTSDACTIILNPLIGAGLAFATTVATTAAHSAAATDVHNARYDARVSGAFADVTSKLVEKIGDLEAFYNKTKKA
ncbi:hypothetical protein AGMMS49990_06090 [Endomicrobiia bacterium]|nr:hypothetical protein AGMMS49990_06090 [Endomicrobiia bacterium]